MIERKYKANELAALTGSKLIGNPETEVSGINTLENASHTEVSFLANPRYLEAMKASNAGIICTHESETITTRHTLLVSKNPSQAFQQIAELMHPHLREKSAFKGVHTTATIHETAEVDPTAQIGPHAVIDAYAKVGKNTFIGANCYVGIGAEIGDDCTLHPTAIVRERCQLQNKVILQPGAIIGSCGFGYVTDQTGKHTKLEQIGNVIIEDDVEIGANSTIDRARFKSTRIKRGTKIDNLVQIAHNVEIGEDNIYAAQTGIAGSSKTGKRVMMGGQCGVLGHVEITDDVLVATRGGVSKSLLKSGKYRGSPAIDVPEYNRQKIHVRKLESYVKRIKALEAKVEELVNKS